MGNVCSSGQKKNSLSDSEQGEESPAYLPNVNNTSSVTNKNDRLAPLADSESVQDVPNSSESVTKNSNNGSNNDKKYSNVSSIKVDRTESNASKNTQDPANFQSEVDTFARSAANVQTLLQGKSTPGRKIERNKSIVLYLLADNTPDSKSHKKVIYNLQNKLTDMCRNRGFNFMIADMHESEEAENIRRPFDIQHWTPNPLEAEGGHEEAANCLSEISRHSSNSYLVPILFLGSNLGQLMLPLTIESQDFSTVLKAANEEELLKLEKWYAIDKSYQPLCHRLQTKNLKISQNHNQQAEELNDLLQILLKLFTDDLKDSYLTTLVEQEINHTVLMSQELSKRCIWVQTGPQYIHLPEQACILEKEEFRRINKIHTEMKSHLSEKNIIRITQNMNLDDELQFAIETLMERLINIICEDHQQRTIIPLNTNGVDKVLLEELYDIAYFSKLLSQNAANFDIMDDVKTYLHNKTQYPLVVFGSRGCGKSVLASKIMENIYRWKPEAHLILRYANLCVHSADLVSMLGSIAHQMSILAFGYQIKCEHSIESYSKIIHNILDSSLHFYVIVIDGVDELLQDNNLQWLPINLNHMTKIILTVTQSNDDNTLLNVLAESGIPQSCFLGIKDFTESQWQDILNTGGADYYAANGALNLPTDWKQLQGKTAFHAKCLCWLAWLGQFEAQNDDLNEVVIQILDLLENKIDQDYARYLLLMISLTDDGMSETDCLAILQNYIATDNHYVYRIWAKFCWIMGPLLLHLKNVRIANGTLRTLIKERFIQEHNKMYKILHDYFTNQPSLYANSSNQCTIFNVQKFQKLPYQHFYMILEDNENILSRQQALFNCIYFTDPQWIMHKVEACGPAHLLHDILTAENLSNLNKHNNFSDITHIKFLKDFLRAFMQELSYDGSQCLTLMKYFLKMSMNSDANFKQNEILHNWLEYINKLISPHLEICNANLDTEFCSDIDEEIRTQLIANEHETETNNNSYDGLINLPQSGYYVASISTERHEICIWDVQSCQRIRILNGIPQPTAMCPLANYEAAVLCRREIKVINLDEGTYKITLKGVMNQKMPYFGLHDQNHLVCLSRNRMYVNLMNLESGDCVTTFKAGEDRFLNSLLVSGDGRILVCGDETQKPFPLLVWHLTQRKLLYDLRIPHHDFITALSAITYEGSYVCVVAKELNEPTPNFIVVYDLQSGTLFKKWKPNCNTVSLAISQLNACVIAGLENAKILIWDLVTGNCRSTFIGHTAPVTFLKLDPLGKVLLSRDKEGRDKAIRIWELKSGKFLAAYKPPGQIICCEILPNGTHIVLALKKSTNILILALKNFSETTQQNCNTYGKEENYGKTFQLNLS